jgi:hypothetical protein
VEEVQETNKMANEEYFSPLQEMPPEISQALFGDKTPAVPQSAEPMPAVNPWTTRPNELGAIEYIDADGEEKSYGAVFSELEKVFFGGSVAVAPESASERFRFSKRTTEEPKADPVEKSFTGMDELNEETKAALDRAVADCLPSSDIESTADFFARVDARLVELGQRPVLSMVSDSY